jgi:hypothetical protein
MYVKSISQIVKEQIPVKLRLFEGSSVYGKIISLENGKGAIKLYDGTIIPAIFISDHNLEKDKFTKFVVQSFDGDNLILRVLPGNEDNLSEESLNSIIRKLNIPYEEGKEIILSLIKFNLPAKDENIFSIYKNLSFLNSLKNYSEEDILKFLQKYISKDINSDSREFAIAKEIISKLQNINVDFLSFFIENDIPQNLDNFIKVKNFIDEKQFLNKIIDSFYNGSPIDKNHQKLISLDDIIQKLKSSPKILSSVSHEELRKNLESIDILKYLYNNYNLYAFNLYDGGNVLRNNIIIKNRYKGSKKINPDDVKVYISVDTPNVGAVEGYIYKRYNELTISLSVEKKYLSLFKKHINTLKDSLDTKGYNVLNISVNELLAKSNIINLSNFFGDSMFKELDVKV